MQSMAHELVAKLTEAIRLMNSFEFCVLLESVGGIREFRASVVSNNPVKLHIKNPDGVTHKQDTVPDLGSAFARIAEICTGGACLVDSLIVRIAASGEDERVVPCEHELYSLTRAVCENEAVPRLQPITSINLVEAGKQLNELFSGKRARQKREYPWMFQSNVWLRLGNVIREIEITSLLPDSDKRNLLHIYRKNSPFEYTGVHYRVPDIDTGIKTLGYLAQGSELLVDTIMVKANSSDKDSSASEILEPTDPVYALVQKFWLACCGGEPAENIESLDPKRSRQGLIRSTLLAVLNDAKNAVAEWNKLSDAMRTACEFHKVDFANRNLTGLNIDQSTFKDCDFTEATLKKIGAKLARLNGSVFCAADLTGSNFSDAKLSGADFTKANLQKCKLTNANLRNAIFEGTNITGADLKDADLRGTDLSGCVGSENARFKNAEYNEHTKLPVDFQVQNDLLWTGKGSDPYVEKLLASSNEMDFASLLEFMKKAFDSAKLSKSLSMLKSEAFQLYFEENNFGVVGVIKSQTDPELVYACHLGTDGSFSCCTQNLRPCGGLKGSLCKHILVLTLGLARTGHLIAGDVAQRAMASKSKESKLNKEMLSDVFIKYKGAESGDLDWRPTETVPEDYYAF